MVTRRERKREKGVGWRRGDNPVRSQKSAREPGRPEARKPRARKRSCQKKDEENGGRLGCSSRMGGWRESRTRMWQN